MDMRTKADCQEAAISAARGDLAVYRCELGSREEPAIGRITLRRLISPP